MSYLGLTWLDPTLKTLPYAPERSVSLGVTYAQGPWRVSADAQYQSRMYVLQEERVNGASNTEQVDAFTVVNLRVGHAVPALGEVGEVFLAVENLFDRDYQLVDWYNQPGREFGLNLRWQPAR